MKQILLLISAVLFIATSCTDRIEISTIDSPPTIVIYGKLSTDLKKQSISITRSTGYFATTKPPAIRDAEVWVRFDDQEVLFSESSDYPGVYESPGEMACVEGTTYHLSVEVDFDEDGETELYTASSYVSPAARLDTVTVVKSSIFKKMYEVKISALLPENVKKGEGFYRFHILRNGELVNDSLRGVTIADDKFLGTDIIEDMTCFFLNQEDDLEKIQPGDRIGVQVDALTKDFAYFLMNAQAESMGSIPMFSGPPANVETNIKSSKRSIRPAGFFAAYSTKRGETIFQE